jgi:peptidoglycan/LPS O-acetylase OafA/YrhL
MNEKKEEILFLNLLRFFAALSIVYVHTFIMLLSVGYLPSFLNIFSSFAQYGYLGVDLFFIISGFVITLSSEGRTVKQFVVARFVRLYPVFWICLSITTILTLLLNNAQHISFLQYVANLTMSPDTYGDYAYIDGSYWTLVVELKFYFFIAILLALRSRVKVSIQKVALFLSILLALYTFLYVMKSTSLIASLLTLFFSLYWTGYAQYFIAGILFYGLYQNIKQYYHYPAILFCYLIAISQALNRSYETNNATVIVLVITLFFLLFFMISFRKIPNTTFSCLGKNYRKILITLGAITYPLYLLHDSISHILIQTFSRQGLPVYIASPLLFFVIISLVLVVNRIDLYIHTKWKEKLPR